MKVTSTLTYELENSDHYIKAIKEENNIRVWISRKNSDGDSKTFVFDKEEFNNLLSLLEEAKMIYED